MKRRSRCSFPRIDLLLLVRRAEQVGVVADGFRSAEKEDSLRLERVMKGGDRLLLQSRLEVDQDVSATDEVHAREGRIVDEILPGEDHHFPQRLADPVPALLLHEKAPQTLR